MKKYPFLHTFNRVQRINATNVRERLSRKPHQLFQPHRMDFYMICLFTEGSGIHTVDFQPINVIPGHILCVAKGQAHSFDPKETYDGNTVVFTEDFFCKTEAHRTFLNRSPLFGDPFRLSYFEAQKYYNEFNTFYHLIIAELKKPTDQYQSDFLHNCLFNMLLLAERAYRPDGVSLNPTRQELLIVNFKKLAEQNLHQQLGINWYADQLNISVRTLQNAFVQYEEETPKQWLTKRTILEIKRLLTFESKPINEISYQLGFNELSNFVKFFKTNTGVTPSQFRNGE